MWCFFICMYEKDEEYIMCVWIDDKPSARCCWASTLLPPVPPGTTVSPCLALSSSSCLFCWRLPMFLTLSQILSHYPFDGYAILSWTRFVLEAMWQEQRGLRVYIGSRVWDIVYVSLHMSMHCYQREKPEGDNRWKWKRRCGHALTRATHTWLKEKEDTHAYVASQMTRIIWWNSSFYFTVWLFLEFL